MTQMIQLVYPRLMCHKQPLPSVGVLRFNFLTNTIAVCSVQKGLLLFYCSLLSYKLTMDPYAKVFGL